MGLLDNLLKNRRRKNILKGINSLRRTTVGDILTKYMISIRSTDSIVKAATKMIAEDVSCLVVLEGRALRGILSERDFLLKVPLTKKALSMQVKDIMTPKVVTVPPEMKLPEAVALMEKKGFRRLVVAKGEHLFGLVTQTDFSRKIQETFPNYPLSEEMTAARVLRQAVIVTPKESFVKAREKMKKMNIGSVLIVDKLKPPHTLQGVFSEYDVVMQFFDQKGELDIKELTSFMRKYVRGIPPRANVFEINHLLLKKKVHRMPVMEYDHILGLLTQTYLVRFVYRNLDKIEGLVKDPETKISAFSKKKLSGTFRGEHFCVYLEN